MRYLVPLMLVVVAVIHLMPLVGVLGVDRLQSLYGLSIDDRNLEILMRHRAVLFGMLGGLLLVAAFYAPLRTTAFILGFVSVLSFLALSYAVGGYNAQLARVFMADVIALVCLIVGAWGHFLVRQAS